MLTVKQTRANKERSRAHPECHTSRSPAIDEDHIVFWSDDEDVCAPIHDWDNWHVSYKQPSRSAKFYSSDWVMYLHSIPLWLPSSYQEQ